VIDVATPRTAEEKLAIVEHCMDLEREGGDIQAYLYSEHYYSPRATWHNIQREYLHRKPYERTDGKPTKKGDGNMVILTDDQRMEAVTLAIEGKNPKTYLEGLGCPDPEQTWYRIRQWCKDKRPDAFEKLPTKGKRYEKSKDEEQPVVKIDGPIRIETPEANKVEIVEKPEKPKKPVTFGDYEVTAVRDKNLGEFYYDHDHNCIDWRDGVGDEISLSINGWKILIERLPEILGVLGVKP
jgi:hypothetical protein